MHMQKLKPQQPVLVSCHQRSWKVSRMTPARMCTHLNHLNDPNRLKKETQTGAQRLVLMRKSEDVATWFELSNRYEPPAATTISVSLDHLVCLQRKKKTQWWNNLVIEGIPVVSWSQSLSTYRFWPLTWPTAGGSYLSAELNPGGDYCFGQAVCFSKRKVRAWHT